MGSSRCEPIKKAIRDQLDRLPYYSAFRGSTTSPLIELSYEVVEWFRPDGMARAFFTSGGSTRRSSGRRLWDEASRRCARPVRRWHSL
jgi:putrescine---pyruvate transaminase